MLFIVYITRSALQFSTCFSEIKLMKVLDTYTDCYGHLYRLDLHYM